jgi:hypothetical protein
MQHPNRYYVIQRMEFPFTSLDYSRSKRMFHYTTIMPTQHEYYLIPFSLVKCHERNIHQIAKTKIRITYLVLELMEIRQ